jgi:hypothetical protein
MNAIDTNVWLYSHDTRDPLKQGIAQQLIVATRPIALAWHGIPVSRRDTRE